MASILIAEDDAAERGLLARGLAADGHRVVEAENGQVALQRLLADPGAFDILVTDVEMPELDGIELARNAIAAKPGLGVLLISGFAGSMDRAADLFAKGARSLFKPVQLEKVRTEVRAMLG
jgi:two-component system cell cycle response regulator CpdR